MSRIVVLVLAAACSAMSAACHEDTRCWRTRFPDGRGDRAAHRVRRRGHHDGWLNATGRVPLSATAPMPLDLRIDSSRIGLGFVQGLTDEVTNVTGSVQMQIHATGSLRRWPPARPRPRCTVRPIRDHGHPFRRARGCRRLACARGSDAPAHHRLARARSRHD